MKNIFYRGKFHSESIRASFHDYSGGVYFVTICTNQKGHFLGEITRNSENDNCMQYSPIGDFLQIQIEQIHAHQPYATIPLWQIMPNHVHLIVVIDSLKIPYQRRKETKLREGENKNTMSETHHCGSLPVERNKETMEKIENMRGWLSIVVAQLKSSVTRFANKNNYGYFGWQANFYEHIIRNQNEMNQIGDYICNNVANWDKDEFLR